MRIIFSNFFEGFFNLFLFLPYFFSIPTLFKTLFKPWKNLIAKKTTVGFSFNEWLSRLSFNLISRTVGFFVRLGLIIIFFLTQSLLLMSFPFVFVIFFLTLPFLYLIKVSRGSEEEKKLKEKEEFITKHLLNKENYQLVESWFVQVNKESPWKSKWWELRNLFAIPPLGRDWAAGYTPTLDKYSEELTSAQYQKKLKHAVGRAKEILQIEQNLSKNEEANVLLVGDEGVGKQTIVDSFARKIYEGKSNTILNYKRILKLNFETILTQFVDQKQRESFFEELLREAQEAKNIILMIENLDKYTSSAPGSVDLSFSIEKFAKNSLLQIVATATPFNFDKLIFPNAKIIQLFNKIDVTEVSKEEAEKILLNISLTLEKRYKLAIPYETLKETIEKSEFYITHIPFPEKAIELLDTTCSYVVQKAKSIVLPQDVDWTLTQITHTPVQVDDKTKRILTDLEKILSSRIIAQSQAITQLSAAIRRSFVVLGKRKKPLASFLFLGPTGVGKTETAKALAQVFFKDEKDLVRFDMSLYQSKNDIPNLIGSTQSQNPGLLASSIRDHPYSVLLLDELEKANPDLLNIFLTILDEGYFTDGFGKKVDCKNLIIVATSNAGSDFIFNQLLQNKEVESQVMFKYLIDHKFFSPEFLNRFDGVVVYNPLGEEALLVLAKRIISRLSSNYQQTHKITLTVSDTSLNDLIKKAYHPEFGARNLERVITQEIEDKVAKKIFSGSVKKGETLAI